MNEPSETSTGDRWTAAASVVSPDGVPEQNLSASPRIALRNGVYTYRVPETELAYGSSLGNAKAWATSKGTGAIESLFSVDVGARVLGSLTVGYFVPHTDLSHFGCPRSPYVRGEECDQLVMLSQADEAVFHLHPAYQQRTFSTIGMIDIAETFFLPRTGWDDEAVMFFVSRIRNRGGTPMSVSVVGCIDLVGNTPIDIVAEYDPAIGGLVAWNQSKPEWARAFITNPSPDAFAATTDIEESYDPGVSLSGRTDGMGALVGALQKDLVILPGEVKEIVFAAGFSPDGRDGLLRVMGRYGDHASALEMTIDLYARFLDVSEVVTPDLVLNQGGQWSKANMIRVLAEYPQHGTAFTNEPGESCNIVARDMCWYVYGNDLLAPDVSCKLLANLAVLQEESGKIIEYYNGVTGRVEDYGLNINDNTPLFILAAAHHLNATAHRPCIDSLYPRIVRAAEYILAQIDDRGLVFCTSRGTGVYGIAGWRNIIENRNISGAVTEVNAECCAALRALGDIAGTIGKPDDRDKYLTASDRLREAINVHLLNPKNGTYYLNIDPDGNAHTEVTADEVFPLLFGVTDEQTRLLISTRLSSPDFLTDAGLRTVPSQNPLYIPDKRVGLEGGVWPGVTWWYAMASANTDPSLMVNALRSSYQHYIEEPGIHNTVPGQFSEWFDGQSLVNRGMRLSPWEPPRFLWALLEGAVGLGIGMMECTVNPRLPEEWRWLRLRNAPYHDSEISFFMGRDGGDMCLYTTSGFTSKHRVRRYEEDVSDKVSVLSADMFTAAFRTGAQTVICLASAASAKQTAAFSTSDLFDPARSYSVSVYSSETGDWATLGPYTGDQLTKLSAWIEPGGYSILSVDDLGGSADQ